MLPFRFGHITNLFLILTCVLPLVVNAQDQEPCNQVKNPENIAYQIAYLTALEHTRKPTEFKVTKDLKPISDDNEDLIWTHRGELLMVTLTRSKYYAAAKPGDVTPTKDYTWFSAVPYLKNFCHAYRGDALNLRILQALGMPPTSCDNVLVEFWINPKHIFRPCPDPEIYDTQCLVEIPLIGQEPKPGRNSPPWFCPTEEHSNQEAAAFVRVSDQHLTWMCKWWTGSYTNDDLYDNYPWTALGYTFDWGDLEDPRGMSEYVVPPQQPITFHAMYSMEAYCGRK